jgi:hypothetical protein
MSSRQAPTFKQSLWCGQAAQASIVMFSSTKRVIAQADAEPESRHSGGNVRHMHFKVEENKIVESVWRGLSASRVTRPTRPD